MCVKHNETNKCQHTLKLNKIVKNYIRSIGDELPQEDILVTVKRVDKDVHKPRHLGLKLKLLSITAKIFPRNGFSFSEIIKSSQVRNTPTK